MNVNIILKHPILEVPERDKIGFCFENDELFAFRGMMISSALFLNGIQIFGHHPKDKSPQGIFCANGQCAQCMVIVDGIPKKACMTELREGMIIHRCNGLPELPSKDNLRTIGDPSVISVDVLVIGGGPAGLSASIVMAEKDIEILIIDDKDRLGGKLILQTHKFFGSQEDVFAGKRGFEIADILSEKVGFNDNISVWLNTSALAIFSDGLIGILKNNTEYVLVKANHILVATGAREKMLIFPGDTLPGVYGAGAFQTLVNRDLIKPANKIFIVGGGNVGLIAGYHALQAGIEVIGLIEALPNCGGYKVHEDKLRRLGVPIYTNHTILSANGKNHVESITITELDENWKPKKYKEKTYECDTILIAVGLNPVNEFYQKLKQFNLNGWIAGDAMEIAEASSAIYTGKIEGYKILRAMGLQIQKNIDEMIEKAEIMKKRPPQPNITENKLKEEGIYPFFHCNQKIPCNPCTTVCPQAQIVTKDDIITELPYFKYEKECIGCGQCVAVCPGLAITLIDFRKDQKNPIVTFPYEMATRTLEPGENIFVRGQEQILGEFSIINVKVLKKYPHTQLVSIKLPTSIAQNAVSITKHKDVHPKPLEIYSKSKLPDDAIVCRCERVTAGEIRRWIKKGVTDINELKALTRASLGACGGKTCGPLIEKLYLDEGFKEEEITKGTIRPLFMEVPLKFFADSDKKTSKK
ncbi:MAG: NAD(P)-binding protein [Candidatus Lokiarchaeota archaeon]|nr:NAD(P)-binding protein [Candidatus Lokiarchaeota archaeon]MBD3202185.1 NAD(P)-binding protein [Candidatus Lokiarchaeota archaeon]